MNTHNDDEPCDCTPEQISAAKRREAERFADRAGWTLGPGVRTQLGSKSPMRPAAIKARRKRERQARRAGRRTGGD